jgi:CarD family transcriptional regulator
MEEHSEELETIEPAQVIQFEVGDSVVYPHHGAGQVVRKEDKEVLGERREYLTIKILHNDMTVMVPTENAARAGLRRVIDEDTVKKVLAVLQDECSEMPKNWNRRFKHNRDKIKTGDVYELAEVVRNLAIREAEKGLSTGEKQMFTRARKILASELMYALEMTAEQVEVHLDSLLLDSTDNGTKATGNGKLAAANGKLASTNGKLVAPAPNLGVVEEANVPSDLALS